MKYLKLRVLNASEPKQDQDMIIRADQITKIFSVPPQAKEKKAARQEVNAFIETANGFTYQTAEKPETILERISESEMLPFEKE